MKIAKTITIDLARAPGYPTVLAVEGDSGTRSIDIRLKANMEPWLVPQGVTASLVYQKPDGTAGWYDTLPNGEPAYTIRENAVSIALAPQVLTAAGSVNAAVVLRDDAGNQLTTFGFIIHVLSSPADEQTSKDYYNLKIAATLEELAARLDELEQKGGAGIPGADGKSAYELAQDAGFEGTVEEWLEFLKGADGAPGGDGQDGAPGKSAYEYAREAGYKGTEAEFAQKLARKVPSKLSELSNDLVSGASVGQTVRITAVDEKGVPTAWEAVNIASGGDKWELITDITVKEEIDAGIIINKNHEGISLSDLKYSEIWIMSKMVGIDSNTNNWWGSKCTPHQIEGQSQTYSQKSNGASSGGTIGIRSVSYYHFIRGGKMYWTDGGKGDVFLIAGGDQCWVDKYLDYYTFDYFTEVEIVADSTRVIGVDTEIRILGRRG